MMKTGARLADWNVMVSEQEYRWILAELGVTKVSYIPHSVDSLKYSMSRSLREEFCFTVCWMKRPNAKRKCMFELISSIPLIRRVIPCLRFIIAGSFEDGHPELHALAVRLGVDDAVRFLGRISTEEKIRRMQTCQVYLQPTRYEGFGVAIAEAMSCGAPVVTSRVGAVPEVVGDCGQYVDGSDPDSIAAGVIRLAQDRELSEQRSVAGRKRIVELFSHDRRREGLASVIGQLLHQPALSTCSARPRV